MKGFRDFENFNIKFRNLEFDLWNMNNLVNSALNMSENFKENKVPRELGDTQNYCDQGVSSSDEVQMQQDSFVHPEYRESYENYPGKIETKGKLENIDFNQLIQPVHKVSLNGSKIYLPPIPKLNENSDQLGQCIERVCQIREFVRKVAGDRKNYVENILQSYN